MKRFAMVTLRIGLFSILVWGWASVVGAQQPYWPRFHGPNENNISSDKGLLQQWPKGGPPLVWTAKDIGEGYAGVTLAHGLIYTAGNIDNKMVITALTLGGKVKWQVPNGEAYKKSYPGSRGTPTIDGDRLYHESPNGDLICLNAITGRKIWSENILKKFKGKQVRWALAESVLIDGEHVICCPGGSKTAMVALNKRSGKTVWQSPAAEGDLAGYASPMLIEQDGLRIILTMTDKALIGVNADSGQLLFRYAHPTKYDVNAMMPLYHKSRILISSGYGTTGTESLKLTVRGKKASVEKVWAKNQLDNHHGGIVLYKKFIYGAGHNSGKGKWMCLSWNTGRIMWAAKGVGKGSITCADGMLYTMSETRNVGLVRPTPEKYELISEFEIPRGGKGKSWAHPVVCGGRLYIRHGNFLYAYNVAK